MPKPILVFQAGNESIENFTKTYNFLLTSDYTKSIRDEYHILAINGTKDENCYIISADQPKHDIDPVPHTINKLKEQLSAYAQCKAKSKFASGGIVSGPSFGNTDHGDEMVVPFPKPAERLMVYLDMITDLRKAAKDIAERYSIPDSKISKDWPKSGYTPKEAREMEEKSTVKDPNEKASFFGYKIRRSTMQDLESLMLTGGYATFKASDDGEIFITHASLNKV